MAGQVHPSHTLSEKLFQQLKFLTENNLHGDAYLAAAQALGLSKLERELTRINLIHARVGHLSPDLNQQRYRTYVQLLQTARTMLSKQQYDRLHMCF